MKINRKELETLVYLENIIEAYEEIAAIRMRRVKNFVLQNREFLGGLRQIFYKVKYSYKNEMKKLEKKNKASYIRNTNGKVISVFLSANTGLYGAIVSKTFDSFLTHIKNTKTDIAVVGKVGKRLFDALDLQDRTIRHFSLADSGLDRENMKTLLAFLVNYETIVVFHGKFKDILSQEPTAVSISGDVLQVDEESNIGEVRYIFEPTLESVMSYFETEILSSIFEQSVYESNLSKYASRMISLDRAIERIHSRAYTTKMITQKAKHRVRNNKQLNTISGIYRRIQNG